MPLASQQLNSEFYTPYAVGPVLQCVNPIMPTPVPATIAAGATFNSGLIVGDGYKVLAAGVTLSQAGTIGIQRYLDMAGLVNQGTLVSATLTAGTANVVNVDDGLPFALFEVTIYNSSGTVANVSNFALLMNAA